MSGVAVSAPRLRRVRLRVEGTVQGVGFRPHVHRLAGELDLAGWVRNDRRGVVAEVEGYPLAVEAFLRLIAADAPPLARVERVLAVDADVTGERGFSIVESAAGGAADALVAPDAATCEDCLRELADPADRRFRYPFVNCTNCGPRYTIVRGVPYDRASTTMAGFELCPACRAEYHDPADRRFHAQPNACPQCGPQARLLDAGGDEVAGASDAVAAAAAALRRGAIVAVKGLGVITWPAWPRTPRRSVRCAPASTARTGPSRCWLRTSPTHARWCSCPQPPRRCCWRPNGRSCSRRAERAPRWPPPSPRATRTWA